MAVSPNENLACRRQPLLALHGRWCPLSKAFLVAFEGSIPWTLLGNGQLLGSVVTPPWAF